MTNLKFSFLLNLHPINPAKAEEKSSNALGSISAAPSQFAESQKLQGGNDELVNVVNNSDWATILCEASFLENVHRLMGSYCFSGSWGTQLRWARSGARENVAKVRKKSEIQFVLSLYEFASYFGFLLGDTVILLKEVYIHSVMLERFILVFSNLICWNKIGLSYVSSLYISSGVELILIGTLYLLCHYGWN